MLVREALERNHGWVVRRLVRQPDRMVDVALNLEALERELRVAGTVALDDRNVTIESIREIRSRLGEAALSLYKNVGG